MLVFVAMAVSLFNSVLRFACWLLRYCNFNYYVCNVCVLIVVVVCLNVGYVQLEFFGCVGLVAALRQFGVLIIVLVLVCLCILLVCNSVAFILFIIFRYGLPMIVL